MHSESEIQLNAPTINIESFEAVVDAGGFFTACEAQLWFPVPPDSSYKRKNTDKQLCRCLQAQEQFLREHPCIWVPKFGEHVLKTSTSRFLQGNGHTDRIRSRFWRLTGSGSLKYPPGGGLYNVPSHKDLTKKGGSLQEKET